MSPKLKHIVPPVYGFALLAVCLFCAVLSATYGWSERTRSKSSAATSVVVALFFVYMAVVFLLQAIRSRQYERVTTSLGFVPLDWKDVPFNDVLRAIFQGRKKMFLSRVVHGEACGTHVYLFNRARDVAWRSEKRTTIVFEQSQTRNSDDVIKRCLSEKGNADLAFHGHWCMIQARHEIKPTALPQWLETVFGITKRSQVL
jgi:hypothetical protein